MSKFLSYGGTILSLALAAQGLSAQAFSLPTEMIGTNGGSAGWTNQMDWTVTSGVRVVSLDLNISSTAGTAGTIDIYMTALGGTYVGNELVPGSWTMVSSGSPVVSMGRGVASVCTLTSPLIVTPGAYGVAVLYNGVSMAYSNGNGTNQSYSDAFLQIDLGSSTTGLFTGSRFNPRIWNGAVNYDPAAGLFPNFSATPLAGVSPMPVQFTDTTYTSDPAGVATWGWDFDNNGVIDSVVQNPSFTYFGGLWDVALSATDTMHAPATEVKMGLIEVDVVVAAFTATNTNGVSPLAVVFADASTGPITLHEWDFDNDGIVDSNVQNPTFTYVQGGRYTVKLGVSNATSASVDTQADLVVVDEIVASFTASAYAVSPGGSVTFTDTSTGPVTAWAWDFDNDGIVDSILQNPSFTFANPGIFPVKMVATNAFFNEVATATIEVGTIPMPAYSRTYSASTATRGYWFVTPVPFTITGVQVPDEQSYGQQNVAIARVQGTTSTSTYDFLGQSFGLPSNQVIPMSASFAAGDTVYVLGACGDSTIMHNSYATGGPTTLLGNPISLLRAYYQSNIVTAPLSAGGNTLYISTSTTIARVFTAVSDAAGIDYGAGSDNGLGNGAPEMTTTALPVLGTNGVLEVTNTDAGSVSAAIIIGFGRTPLPTPLGTINVSTIAMDIPVAGFTGAGTFSTPIAIPNTPSLLGGPTNFQSVILNPAAPTFFGMSNGVEWFIGSY